VVDDRGTGAGGLGAVGGGHVGGHALDADGHLGVPAAADGTGAEPAARQLAHDGAAGPAGRPEHGVEVGGGGHDAPFEGV
jgi:hypothetical protein